MKLMANGPNATRQMNAGTGMGPTDAMGLSVGMGCGALITVRSRMGIVSTIAMLRCKCCEDALREEMFDVVDNRGIVTSVEYIER